LAGSGSDFWWAMARAVESGEFEEQHFSSYYVNLGAFKYICEL
jgi:hypothetical protein